ncbi:hypothetical protein PR202_ga14477 [Eleusine coracana subsp. coracana]|uniref:TFIIS N-terminal domain-containing protein n=1 Tax=Eleusine coracana subsp. coracana TaxID=191504 RepID=A0AAV5CHB4_ELECO|nr:hypothetical protein PR202_ga14477 [Eleusine coracana subsp. coracana]
MASRWARSLTSLEHIDAAIEAADPSVSRDEFRRLRAEIVEMLCAGRSHHGSESERVRGLARDIISGWKASVEGHIARMNAAMAKLDALSSQPCENAPKKDIRREHKKTAPLVKMMYNKERQENRTTKANGKAARVEEPLPKKKRAPVATKTTKPTAKTPAAVVAKGCGGDNADGNTKRKLQQGYQEAAEAKRQRKIPVI